ncbi:MAG: glycine/D-amino acid oxidase-like deaminating enzyme [Parasphingorhabdus sp.]|jgi:glycine/D-amino acid oxidase-like deaminating enzyme
MSRIIQTGGVNLEPTDSGWFATMGKTKTAGNLNQEISCDWLVIGGGWMGLHAARRLAELAPEDSIALVDAGRIGNNAAGRCAGFAIDLAHNPRNPNFAEDIKGNQEENHINLEGIAYMRQAVEEHGVTCDWDAQGKYHGAATQKGIKNLEGFAVALDRLNQPYDWIDSEQIKAVTGSSHYIRALHAPGTVLFQPAMYLHKAMLALPSNVDVYEKTPVMEIELDNQQHICRTDKNIIRTKNIILCNNGYLTRCGFFENTAIPVYTYASLTRPLTESEAISIGGGGAFGVIPADSFGTTVRRTQDNRLFMRNLYSYGTNFSSTLADVKSAQKKHQIAFSRRYPEISKIGFEHSWGGMMTLSHNGGMVFGKLSDRVYGTAFCNGTGVSRGTTFGKAIAEFALGQDSKSIRILQSRAQPIKKYTELVTRIGVNVSTSYRFMQAGKEV